MREYGIPFTHGCFIQIYKYMHETELPGLGFMWLSVEQKKGEGSRSLPHSYPSPVCLFMHPPPLTHPHPHSPLPSTFVHPPPSTCSCPLIPILLLTCSYSSPLICTCLTLHTFHPPSSMFTLPICAHLHQPPLLFGPHLAFFRACLYLLILLELFHSCLFSLVCA